MRILFSLLLILLMLISIAPYSYSILKRKELKTFLVQIGIIGVAFIAGLFMIFDFQVPSISRLLNLLSPIKK